MSNETDRFIGELRLGRKITNVREIAGGIAALILGLLFLQSDKITELMGARAPLASILVSFVLGLSLLSVLELLAGSGERGGAYELIFETISGLPAFLTGWGILAGSLTLAASLLLEASEQIFSLFPSTFLPVSITALGLFLLLIINQIFQFTSRRVNFFFITVLLSLILIVAGFSSLANIDTSAFTRPQTLRLSAMNQAIAYLAIGYFIFELVLSLRRQVIDPLRKLPGVFASSLTVFGLLFTFMLIIIVGVITASQTDGNELIADLSAASFFSSWLIQIVAVFSLVFAANEAIKIAARQLNFFIIEGALPRILLKTWDPVKLPVPLFLILVTLSTPLILFAGQEWMTFFAASMSLLAMVALNAVAIYSQQTEPNRRRTFVVPFAPLVPISAIAINFVLILALPSITLISGGIWLVIGSIFYFVYSRQEEIEAREGEEIFGHTEQLDETKSKYRILVPIGPGEDRHLILRMAASLSNQLQGQVIPLQVIIVPDPLAIGEGKRTAQERNTLFSWSTRMGRDVGVPIHPITRLARNIPEGIIDTAIEEECDLILLSWLMKDEDEEPRIGPILSQVVREAPCDVAVVAYRREQLRTSTTSAADRKDQESQVVGEIKFHPSRILVPTAGGPNAPLAIRIALLFAREYDSTVSAIYAAEPDASVEEIAEGERRIAETIEAMRRHAEELPSNDTERPDLEEIPIKGEVITAESIVDGLAEASKEFDLILLGASEESILDQVLFGNIPERVARASSTPSLIVKRYRGLHRLWLQRFWDTLYQALPTLTQEEQIEVYRSIHRGARPDVDFFVMIALSALIATFGLLQNSGAVIIGAMLVAPLFSPLLAISLAIVQGNVRLLRLAIESTLKGVALAIGVATLLGYFAPFKTLTEEIAFRTQPSLFDLIVALASGIAGAYAIARKDVAAALPGVAIAAALVPPLGVLGIGLSLGRLDVAGGGTLLILSNLIAIALGGSLTFLLLGFRPGARGMREVHLRRGLLATIILFLLVTIPLAFVFIQSIQQSNNRQAIQNFMVERLEEIQELELVSPDEITFQRRESQLIVTVPVYTKDSLPQPLAEEWSQDLTTIIHQPVIVRLVGFPLIEAFP